MKKLYTIRDVKAQFGSEPGIPAVLDMPNDDFAIRLVKGSMAPGQKPNALNTFPEDKELWCIGEFDDRTGSITPIKPYLVARAIDYLIHEVDKDDSTQSKDAIQDSDSKKTA